MAQAQNTPGSTRRGAPPLDGDTRFLDPAVLARISNLEMIARFIVQGFLIGLHKSPYHGFSSEFSAYRKYAKGDSFKFIDWKVAGRTDRLYIKQFEENTNTRVQLLVDASGSMRMGGSADFSGGEARGVSKWIYSRNLAAALAYLMNQQGDAVGLTLFREGRPDVLSARGGVVHLHQIYQVLSRTTPGEQTDTQKGLSGLPERFPSRGLVVMISDLLDEPERIISVLKDFRFRRHEIILFHLLSPEEREFPYRDNIEFVDVESDAKLITQSSYVAKAYRDALAAHTEKLERFCRQNDIDFVPLSTDALLGTALLAYLNRRQRMA